MLYLSDLVGKKIVDSQGNTVARITDLVAKLPEEAQKISPQTPDEPGNNLPAPYVKGLLARTGRRREPFFLPIAQVKSLDAESARLVSAKLDLQPFERRPDEMLLVRDLWDKQVINLETRKVVRVNDVALANGEGEGKEWEVQGVDMGLGALLRRMRVGRPVYTLLQRRLQPGIVEWCDLEVFGSSVPGGINLPHKGLAHMHPVEIARITDSVSYHQGAEIIASLDDTLAADTLEEIEESRQSDIVEYISEERAADILEEMSPDEASDLLADLPEEKADSLLQQMDAEEAEEVRYLMRYSERSAGGRMTTDFVQVLPTMSVGEVIETNREILLAADLIYYMYAVDTYDANNLVGIITVRDLLVHERHERVESFMLTTFICVPPDENEQEVARKMAEYNLLALPVVDAAGKLLGIVTVDDALDALLPEGWKKRLPRIFR